MQGGAISFKSPYLLRTIDSFKGKDDITELLTAVKITGTTRSDDSLGAAVLLTNAKTINNQKYDSLKDLSPSDLDEVVGVSWYAAIKIMEEVIHDKSRQNILTAKLFTIDNLDNTKPSNKTKMALIAFIHGILAYQIASVGNVGNLESTGTFKQKYDQCVTYIKNAKGKEKGHIEGIWRSLTNRDEDVLSDIQYTMEYNNLETFLRSAPSAPEDENPSPSAASQLPTPPQPPQTTDALEFLFKIPTEIPIHSVLEQTK